MSGGVTADPPTTGTRLKAGATIPVSQTTPALDLTTLFNGFQPLFQALTPKQVNELSMNLVQVLQGEGGTVQELLANTASLTNSLADRDQLIGEVINNLSTTLDTVDQRHQELNTLVTELQRWMGDLARDRDTIGSSLDNISDLTVVVADLLRQGRPLLKDDIVELKKLAKLLNKPQNQQQITELLDRLPESMTDQTRTGTYGSWYSYYVCGFSGQITLPGNLGNIPGLQQVLDGSGQPQLPLVGAPLQRRPRDSAEVRPVRRYTESQLIRLGAITVVVMLVIMAAAFNLGKFPGFGGDTYQAYFTDASGLHKGNMVQVGGIRVGRVQDVELDKGKVLVSFEVDHGVEFGKDSEAQRRGAQPARREVPQPGAGRRRPARPGHPDPGGPHLVVLRHRRRLRRPDRDHRADRHPPARPGPRRRRRHGQPVRARDPGQLRGHRPALALGVLPRLGDPVAAAQLAQRQRAARRPQRRPRRPDAEQQPDLQGGASGARRPSTRSWSTRAPWPSSCAGSPPTTRTSSSPR